MSNQKVKVGIAGLGRSGWDIHARAFQALEEQFQVVAVMDLDPTRRAQAMAELGANAYDDYAALVQDPNVEVVVVATPNFLHTANVIQALEHGKHAVCEKPFGLASGDADAMIASAKSAAKLVAPFQNRRYEPHFLKVKSIIDSGLLGDVHLIRIAWHGFKRRWDWQTLNEFGGGDLSNTGPHVIDHAIQLFGPEEPEVTADLRNVLSSGDAEDHVKIVLRALNAPVIDIELTSANAYPQDRWLVMGDRGGLRGTPAHLEWKWVDWSGYEPRPVERRPTPDRGYNSEKLEWQSDSWKGSDDFAETPLAFYRDLYRALREGAALTVTPESVRRNIALIETAKCLAPVRQGRFALKSE